jgi:hypothetical protein
VLALGVPAQERILEAMGRLLRGNTRAMDASCRYDDRRFAVLLSGVGLATAHSRMEGLRRKCATQIVVLDGQELGFTTWRWAWPASRTPRTRRTNSQAACEAALAEAQRRGGNHVTLASDPLRGLSLAAGGNSASSMPWPPGRQQQGKQALERADVEPVRRARAQRRHQHAGHGHQRQCRQVQVAHAPGSARRQPQPPIT